MCHLILLLPVVALPVFWLLPLGLAAPVYGTAVGLAGIVYYYAWDTGRRPARIGRERLQGAEGEVLTTRPLLRVRVHSEIWQARSDDNLSPGDTVQVDRLEGLTLFVSKADAPIRNLHGTRS